MYYARIDSALTLPKCTWLSAGLGRFSRLKGASRVLDASILRREQTLEVSFFSPTRSWLVLTILFSRSMTSNLSGSRFSGAAYDVYPKLLFFARSVPCHARLDAGGSALDTQVPPPTIFFLLRALARYYWTPAVLPTSAELFARPAPSHTRLSVRGSARDTQVPPPNDFFFSRASVRYSRTRAVLPASAELFAQPTPSHTRLSVGGSARDRQVPPLNDFFFAHSCALFPDAGGAPRVCGAVCTAGALPYPPQRRGECAGYASPAPQQSFFSRTLARYSRTRAVLPASAESFARPTPSHARLDNGRSARDTQVPPSTIFFSRALARYSRTRAVLPAFTELSAHPTPSHTHLSSGSARDTQVPPPNNFFFRALLRPIPGRERCSLRLRSDLHAPRPPIPASASGEAREIHASPAPPAICALSPDADFSVLCDSPRPLPHSGSHSSLTLVSFILLPTLSIDFTSLVPLLLSTPPWRALSQLAFDRLNRGSGEPLPELLRRPTSATTPPTLEAAILAPPSPSDKPGALYAFDIPTLEPNRRARRTIARHTKIGWSKHPLKRQRQWLRQCRGQVQEWWAYWTVLAAAKFEALIHLHFKLMGAWILPSECEFCGVNHCELFDFLACGGREGIARVVEFYHRRLNWPVSK
ncbi:hypothetical protein B0H19DRAFT_1069824 [Mycena capillaripes]|nr:hypothetical protein B0H19DRAFT_1069824 [Mycena capillaripes]